MDSHTHTHILHKHSNGLLVEGLNSLTLPSLVFMPCVFLCLSPVASFTFYLAESGPELSAPTSADDNIISFLPIDPPDLTQVSGQEPEDETGTLTVSDVTSDGFDLSWEWKADVLYDSYTVELTDVSGLWDSREIHLAGDAAGSRIRGLNASTEYQVRLYGVINSQRSSPFEAVAVTGIKFRFKPACQTSTTFYLLEKAFREIL